MKIKSIVAVGAMGVGLGLAGFVAGTGTASAACNEDTPPLSIPRVACVTNANIAEFRRTTSPQYNLDVLVNGTKELVCSAGPGAPGPGTGDCEYENSGLGLRDQLSTFQSSVRDFFDGPREPDTAPLSQNETP